MRGGLRLAAILAGIGQGLGGFGGADPAPSMPGDREDVDGVGAGVCGMGGSEPSNAAVDRVGRSGRVSRRQRETLVTERCDAIVAHPWSCALRRWPPRDRATCELARNGSSPDDPHEMAMRNEDVSIVHQFRSRLDKPQAVVFFLAEDCAWRASGSRPSSRAGCRGSARHEFHEPPNPRRFSSAIAPRTRLVVNSEAQVHVAKVGR
jgi:hypothetical protein